ncbi:hypothetical protein GYMLUDRAFT_58773 [Collybiopsis luxurians FD-317 M1]|uniref:SUZ domain-containing protein n=1 Tax=Collybiopsis luxurians FD-317 M1 TaxID=944289 RepID=A0A0D0CZ07_9AGAR|nr:hypothetical protein GYMLUDRAFT_58773 [Collybiopsis luxurians FD-317 M1]
MSDFGNVAPSLTASSSTTSLVVTSEGTLSDSPSFSSLEAFNAGSIYPSSSDGQNPASSAASSTSSEPDVDPSILEALRSKDRIYVLKLGETMEELINERKSRVSVTPATSYQRMLLHRCSAYYRLRIEVDSLTKEISAVVIAESRIPNRRLADLVPPEPTPQPAFRIIQRSPHERRVKPQSHAGSVTGEDADSSDIEPSETSSVGGRSSVTGASTIKKWMTMEEREAAYNEARSRIFMGFDEKKDKDMSASSSSASLASSSTSSLGDGEEPSNSIATESDLSGPSGRKESRRGNKSRPPRSSFPSFPSSGSGSSRNSRAPSPSFTYPSLYEPPPSGGPFEPAPGQQYPPPSHPYSYSAPTHPNPPFMPSYPGYFYPYGQPHPPMPPSAQNSPEPPISGEVYQRHPPPPPPTSHQMMYSPYFWHQSPHPHPPPPAPLQSAPPLQPQNGSAPGGPPGPPGPSSHHSYPLPPPFTQHPPGYGYPTPGYYTPPGDQSMASLRRPGGQPFDERSMSVPLSAMGPHTANNLSHGTPNPYATNANGIHHAPPNGNAKPRTLSHQSWSFGPGPGMGGPPIHTSPSTLNSGLTNGETTGPRLHSMRRQSNTSNGSSSGAYRSSNSDDVSSIAVGLVFLVPLSIRELTLFSQSSSTSSSSRRTYTSTSSSQHPLPPRPDWAVGLKPDPTLHSTSRHHDPHVNNSKTMSPVSSARGLNGPGHGYSNHNPPRRPTQQSQSQPPPMSFQSADFPPLTSMATPERRPAAGNVWTNASRSVIMTPPSSGTFTPPSSQGQGTTLIHHPSAQFNINSADDANTFQRPPPKAAELYNPKSAGKRPQNAHINPNANADGQILAQVPVAADAGGNDATSLSEQVKVLSLVNGPQFNPSGAKDTASPM